MDNRKRILWITRTAVFTALLVVSQAATAPLNMTLVTGSIVNLILIAATVLSGPASGIVVAIISPVMAKLFGIGPLWELLPFIMLGNVSITVVWHLILRFVKLPQIATYIIAAACGAVAKFAVLYLGVVRLAVPVLLELPEKQATVISAMFSVPQLITAAIGGAVACIILPFLKNAISQR